MFGEFKGWRYTMGNRLTQSKGGEGDDPLNSPVRGRIHE
ncbi:MAG: hypothetical protein JWO54_413 [Candidatus Saccharibacteria bacterium]|nr:hypothetical protein [Candidatus Saccharibacteria bacterium]